jgi:DNA-binding winged helix-turn-helix (wHTH) protein
MSSSPRCLYEFEGFRLNPAERLLAHNGAPVPLAPKAFEMLVVLVSNSGRLLTKDELMSAVWADAVVEENNLDKTYSALRKTLGEYGAERKLIETVRGHGYRFNATVTEIVAYQNNGAPRVIAAEQRDPPILSVLSQLPPLPHPDNVPMTIRTSPPSTEEMRDKESALRRWRRMSAWG